MEGSVLYYLSKRSARAEIRSSLITALSMTEMPTRGWRQGAGVVCWESLQSWSLVGCWLLPQEVGGRNALPGTWEKRQMA